MAFLDHLVGVKEGIALGTLLKLSFFFWRQIPMQTDEPINSLGCLVPVQMNLGTAFFRELNALAVVALRTAIAPRKCV